LIASLTVAASEPISGRPFPTDGHLVHKTLAGYRSAFDELILRYQRQAMAVAYRVLGNLHDAMDVTQDAFLKAFSKLHTLNQAEAFGGWLMRIVSNLSLNFRRSRKTAAEIPLDDLLPSGDPAADPHNALQSGEMGEILKCAMERLPSKQQTALRLFSIEELPQKNVAQTMRCSVEAVKWHVFQGRRRLRASVGEYF
jgi:RNA polymerase sigma-70 factor (ECF subfamily)